jgi:hypothetical protein
MIAKISIKIPNAIWGVLENILGRLCVYVWEFLDLINVIFWD